MNKRTKYELHLTSESKVIDDKVFIATRPFIDFYCPNEQYEVHLIPECKVNDRCSCYHGSKVSIATRSFVDSYCPNKQMYQI